MIGEAFGGTVVGIWVEVAVQIAAAAGLGVYVVPGAVAGHSFGQRLLKLFVDL